MTSTTRAIVLAALLAALAGAVGGWAGIQYGLRQNEHEKSLDEALHHELALTVDQERRIATLEAQFAQSRKTLEAEMRAANHDLGIALRSDHTYGESAKQAIERFHHGMGELQAQTIIHVLAMRAVLTSEQAERFDKIVAEALASDHQ